jgi:NAD(P)-dependent dehydrogenase (short-subunit alcohol dehydrogenase family)
MECAKAQAEAEDACAKSTTGDSHSQSSLPLRPNAKEQTEEAKFSYTPSNKLKRKRAVITGGDPGIGRAVATLFALEGAKVTIVYLPEEEDDAQQTKREIEEQGREVLLVASDLSEVENCKDIIERIVEALGGIDILVNNVGAKRKEQQSITDLSEKQWDATLKINVNSYFYLCKYAIPHMPPGSSIINTASVDSYIGSPSRLDHAVSKGAIIALTRALSNQLVKTKGIRVNAVAAGPIITGSDTEQQEQEGGAPGHGHGLGNWTPMQRVGDPGEVATSYVFLASKEAAFFSGQTLHPNGGLVVNG